MLQGRLSVFEGKKVASRVSVAGPQQEDRSRLGRFEICTRLLSSLRVPSVLHNVVDIG